MIRNILALILIFVFSYSYGQTNHVFLNGKRLIASETAVIHTEENDEEFGLTTSVNLAIDGEKILIIFWQETKDQNMNTQDWRWKGNVMLYLENDETIILTDRNIKGQNIIKKGHVNKYGTISDLYQQYSAYYLTPSECLKLKQSNLTQISYKTTSHFEEGTIYLEILDYYHQTIIDQFLEINK